MQALTSTVQELTRIVSLNAAAGERIVLVKAGEKRDRFALTEERPKVDFGGDDAHAGCMVGFGGRDTEGGEEEENSRAVPRWITWSNCVSFLGTVLVK